jgi:hypothetical protein
MSVKINSQRLYSHNYAIQLTQDTQILLVGR